MAHNTVSISAKCY